MGKISTRLLVLKLPHRQSAFLWGPRKVGKTYWIRHEFPKAPLIDLLKTEVFADYASRPALLRERYSDHKGLLVIDEIQKVPALLDDVHWMIENRGTSFLLTGSSARKLRRGHANLLGGRAWRHSMLPLSYKETEGFNLNKVMVSGLLPPHFLSTDPLEDLRAYVADYLKEEIAAEAQVQNIPAFAEFLRVAAITSSELLDYTNVGREAGVSQKTVRAYVDILEDTLLGFRIPPWKKSKTRRMILTEKFYLFDVGITNYLARRRTEIGGSEFGKAFEQFILMELRAYQSYRKPDMEITFWRTSTGQEIDFILGDKQLAIEIKASRRVHSADLRALSILTEDGPVKRRMVVSIEDQPRRLEGGLEVLPWQMFIDRLWADDLLD
jgi:predicted AAA+ superfamily ATPase